MTLPEGLVSIGYWAFVDNRLLNNIVIPSSVTSIAACPFANCPALTNLTIAEENTHYSMDGMTMIYSAGGDTLVSAHKSADSVFLPGTLRVVNGFAGNHDVRYIHIPDGVTVIGTEAFNGSSLVSIDLPSHLDFIDEYAFYYCQSLTRVGMPATLDTMGEGCFHSCNQLTSIDIPNGLRTIPEAAFFMCTALSHITWGDAVEVIDTCAFGDCSFTELTLPQTLRVVRQTAFIGDYNRRLDKVVFSAPVDTIEMDAFYSQSLSALWLQNSQPPFTTDDGCLEGATVGRIYIPCHSLHAWLADSYWQNFADKYHEDCNGTEAPGSADDPVRISVRGGRIVVEGADGERVQVFDMTGREHNTKHVTLSAGIYLVRVGDRPARKVAVIR